MLRFLLSPRRVAWHLIAVVLVAAMAWLGQWQLGRALAAARPQPPSSEPAVVPLGRLSVPGQSLPGGAYGRRVTVAGSYDRAGQVLVPAREHHGRTGLWVVTPLRLVDGTAVAVVRGWVPSPGARAVDGLGPTRVTLTGRVYPSEDVTDPTLDVPAGLPGGQVAAVDPLALRQRVSYDLRDGFVVATGQRPAPDVAPVPVPARPWPTKANGFPLQNSAYALQWWLFALFVVFMWWRLMRDQWRAEHRPVPVAPDVPAGRAS